MNNIASDSRWLADDGGVASKSTMSSGTSQLATDSAAGSPPLARQDVHQNLQRLDRLANLGLLSASIAHEIKNGLVAVHTHCEVLLERGEDVEMAKMVRRELKRIDDLVSQMLRLAAPKPPAMVPVNVHSLLDLSLRLLDHQIHGRMITLKRDFRAVPEMVRGDESRLQQAFMNLLLNAIEAMGHGGKLTVATENVDGYTRISVQDTGGGIPPENFTVIFDTFYTTKKNGTGLGLAICRRVIEEHHGKIEVESNLGHGSTFYITLPAN